MIRKSEHFELIDRYLDSELSKAELSELEIQLEIDSDLNEELNLHLEVQNALEETDIISLRNNLNQIARNSQENQTDFVFEAFNFGLSDEFSSFRNLDKQINSKDIKNLENTFPKIHLYQHKIAGKENIHQFYKEQFEADSNTEEESFSSFEEELFADIQNALEESDIADIRANLKQVAKSIPAHQFSAEQIDNYIDNLMDPELKVLFEQELQINASLARELQLMQEINHAGAENDIMNLRASLKEIQRSEGQATTKIEEIEAYLYNELSDDDLIAFEAQMAANTELASEIDLVRNIDLALAENDVMQLRDKLKSISTQINSEKQTERSFAARFKFKKSIVSAVAASLILMLGITGLLSRNDSSQDLYQKFHDTYQTNGIARSADITANQTLTSALRKFDNKDYNQALDLFKQVVATDNNNMVGHFYTAVALQETGKFQHAISEYNTVISDKDNLFIEQAHWYIALCYLQTNENSKTYKQFKEIAEKQGFYQEKASAILRKLDYSEN